MNTLIICDKFNKSKLSNQLDLGNAMVRASKITLLYLITKHTMTFLPRLEPGNVTKTHLVGIVVQPLSNRPCKTRSQEVCILRVCQIYMMH
jgi:hypothetical protein